MIIFPNKVRQLYFEVSLRSCDALIKYLEIKYVIELCTVFVT